MKIVDLITVEAIQILAGAQWDVDIPDSIAKEWVESLVIRATKDRKDWGNRKRAYFRDASFYGYESDWDETIDDIEECAEVSIHRFLRGKLGREAYFDEKDKFIPSEYVTKYGKIYQPEAQQGEHDDHCDCDMCNIFDIVDEALKHTTEGV